MTRITLPWPPAKLSPNARVHWAEKARSAKKYRGDCRLLAQAAGLRALNADRLNISVTFCPPDARHRDTDNMLASIKSGLDGIADATGVDDSRWAYTIARADPVKGGAVIVGIEAQTA